jgi:hypothetical protein
VGRGTRDRVTIELRGMRERLQTLAAARSMTTAALVRKALVQLLDDPSSHGEACRDDTTTTRHSRAVKVTIRMAAAHAGALASRARAADVSQGIYVARLLDGTPPVPLPPDHARAVAALVGSTDQLAAMSADLNAFMRFLGRGSSSEIERYRAGVMSLSDDLRNHLALAAPLVAQLGSARRRP